MINNVVPGMNKLTLPLSEIITKSDCSTDMMISIEYSIKVPSLNKKMWITWLSSNPSQRLPTVIQTLDKLRVILNVCRCR